MFEFLSNPLVLLSLVSPLLVMLGILAGYVLSQPRKNRVLKVSPESGRGVELEVKEEDAINVYCDPVGNIPPQRFIKRLNAYSIIRKGWFKIQNYALWFGMYGTAYVTGIEPKKIAVTFKEAVYNVFGKTLYNQIPERQKKQIEDGTIGVMIEFSSKPLTPTDSKTGEQLPSISEDDINRENDERAMKNLWKTYQDEQRSSNMNMFAYVGCGVAIGIILSLIFKWGAPQVTPVAPSPEVFMGLI